MKKYFLSALISFLFMAGHAKNVDETTAINIAKNFYAGKTAAGGVVIPQNLTLAYKCLAVNSGSIEQDVYYVFNVNTSDGFLIVSGEDAVTPILGYSNSGTYNVNNLSPEFKSLMENYKGQIQYAKTKQLAASDKIKARWNDLSIPPTKNRIGKTLGTSVSPMVQTTWNQEPYYNALCPDPSEVPTGCVATAMAQILKYWSYPPKGTGSNSYFSSNYGTLSADFDTTHYNWSAMPDSINSINMDIAILMYDCGVGVDMGYAVGESGAWVICGDDSVCAQSAFVKYFQYDSTTIKGLYRTNYQDTQWDSLLVNELNNGRPIQYAGFGSAGGHTWVCDGYEPQYNLVYYHMNWGWGGEDNGYFEVDSLNPPGTGYSFNTNEEALIGIQPPSLIPVADFAANSTITCVGATVQLKDHSSATPTKWKWTVTPAAVTFTNGTSNTSQNPAIILNANGSYTVKLVVYNNNGSDSTIKTAYLTTGLNMPYSQNFESSAFPPAGCSIYNADGDTTWEKTNVNGSSAAVIDFYNYAMNIGSLDDLLFPPTNVSGANIYLSFKIAYKYYPGSYGDSLRVYVSTDCSNTFGAPLYSKGGKTLAGGAADSLNSSFIPASSADWREESINLASYSGQTIIVKFEAENGFGNNLYIDDVQITTTPSTTSISPVVIPQQSITVYPNPANNVLNIETQDQDVKQFFLINVLGQLVISNLNATGVNNIDISALPQGLYLLKMQTDNGWTDKKINIVR